MLSSLLLRKKKNSDLKPNLFQFYANAKFTRVAVSPVNQKHSWQTSSSLSCSDMTAVLWIFSFVKGGGFFFSLSADRDRKISPSERQLSLPSCLPLFLEMQLLTSVTDVVLPLLALQPDPGV